MKPTSATVELDSGISGIVLPLHPGKPSLIVDIGTGSGCIALTLRAEGVKEHILAVDVSSAALEVAKKNATSLGIESTLCMQGDGADVIAKIQEPFLVVSNPPYIPEGTHLSKDVALFEPAGALFSGKDGLDLIRRIMASAKGNPHCVGVILECRTDQVEQIQNML
jgi:release factor glutamine methyltransferase